MLFDVDANVFPVGVGIVRGGFVQFAEGPEDSDGGHGAPDADHEEYHRGQDGEQVSQDVDQESETDKQQPDDEQPGCEVSRRLGNDICIKAKTHGRFQTLINKYNKNNEYRTPNIELRRI